MVKIKFRKNILLLISGWVIFSFLNSPILAGEELTRITISSENLSLIEETKRVQLKEGINEIILTPVSTKIVLDSVYPSIEDAEFIEQEHTSNSLFWKVKSNKEETTLLKVLYLISGLKWTLSYRVKLNKELGSMDISGWAKIENKSGRDFYHSFLTLVTFISSGGEEIKISYSLPLPLTFKNGEEKQVPLFLYRKIPVETRYLFDADKYGDEVREEMVFEMVFENKEESGLEALLPPGEVYIYREERGKVFFISKENFPPVLSGGKGSLCLGQAKGLRGEKVQTFYQQLESGEKEYAYRIVLRNLRDSSVKIEVREHLYGEGKILESEPSEYVRENNLILYEIEIPPEEEREAKYKARIK